MASAVSKAMDGKKVDEREGKGGCTKAEEQQGKDVFTNFSREFGTLAEPYNLHVLQSALVDFLFQYKWTVAYPNDFLPYYLQRSAHFLDGLLQPVTEALNRDLDKYVVDTMEDVGKNSKSRGLLNRGMIQVATLSGSEATVEGQVSNYFDITPPVSLNDILNTGNQSNIAAALKSVLQPKEITILQSAANIGAQPRITAEVSENAKLTITPTSLDTASSAELEAEYTVGEPTSAPPAVVNSSATQKDLLDRVSKHSVQTHVRVESLKLFQLSSFTMELRHPLRGTPLPIIGWGWEAIFGTTPGVGRIFRLPPFSKTVSNRSMAIVRAVVVPTAMDIGLSLPFALDRIKDPITNTTDPLNSVDQAGRKLQHFHGLMADCILKGSDCTKLKLSAIPEDLRRPNTP